LNDHSSRESHQEPTGKYKIMAAILWPLKQLRDFDPKEATLEGATKQPTLADQSLAHTIEPPRKRTAITVKVDALHPKLKAQSRKFHN
jgi:hypothetical protein